MFGIVGLTVFSIGSFRRLAEKIAIKNYFAHVGCKHLLVQFFENVANCDRKKEINDKCLKSKEKKEKKKTAELLCYSF